MELNKPKSDWSTKKSAEVRSYMRVGGGTVSVKGSWSSRLKEQANALSGKTLKKVSSFEKLKKLLSGIRSKEDPSQAIEE